MVSFWPWGRDDQSPASFEKALSGLATKITSTQARLDQTRTRSRRMKALATLYLVIAYLVYGIVELLVVGWKSMGPMEWTGMAGGPVLITLVRASITAFYEYRIERLGARLKEHQEERAKTIQKLKDATKYDSTLELLEKYGGESRNKPGPKPTEEGGAPDDDKAAPVKAKHQGLPSRINMPPPPTANIQHPPTLGPNPAQPHPLSRPVTPVPAVPQHADMAGPAEFAPNAFDGKPPHAYIPYPSAAPVEPRWYDRILDMLLGEDETAAKNRIALICARCRLVNGQAPPGTKSLSELGMWKCMACGAPNGEIDEGKRIVAEVLGARAAAAKENAADDAASRSSEELVEVKQEVEELEKHEAGSAAEGARKRRGKAKN
ncbi:hypothetical protein VTJ83DRAFT_1529 [Remersonia thermophila]|uniref:Endoplasmic reticulum junction formation protein lunapark n=1 Tax=Remersonia thermophila TaxID=72144 RepID=A0ABR4DG76_9PEZI